MKMFKRLAAVLLAGVMVLAMLTACGGGTAEASFEDKVQSKYMAALNDAFGTHLSNDSDVKAVAETVLNNIKNGEISQSDVSANKTTDNNKTYLAAIACVEGAASSKAVYNAVYYEEATAQQITLDEETIDQLKLVVDALILTGETYNVPVKLTGLGVATKTIEGKTYVAIGFKMAKA